MRTLNLKLKRQKAINYNQYVEQFLINVEAFKDEPNAITSLHLGMREMQIIEIRNLFIIIVPLMVFFGFVFNHVTINNVLIIIAVGILMILLTVLFIERYLPNWKFLLRIKTQVSEYLKVVDYVGIDNNLLREYLTAEKQNKPAPLAKALYEETKVNWINDKKLQETSFERILILYYAFNKKLNIKKNQAELVYLVSSLINVGESNASGEKVRALRLLNDMYVDNVDVNELTKVRRYLIKTKAILQELIALIDRDISKLDSLK